MVIFQVLKYMVEIWEGKIKEDKKKRKEAGLPDTGEIEIPVILPYRIEEFEELIELTSNQVNIPSSAVRKDYFITIILKNLAESEYLEHVVFKGGTSLSKCYPGSIDRFSEDIDLTYVPEEGLSNKQRRYENLHKDLLYTD